MFKVSTLLLDEAFKLVTPLTNGVIHELLWQFAPLSDISQGRVATRLRWVGIFSDGIIANFFLILTVKIKLMHTKKLCQFLRWPVQTVHGRGISLYQFALCIFLRSFVSSGAAVDCWQSFDVPSATASTET